MAKIEAKLTVEVSPEMMAELFAGMDNEAQASFLLRIGDYTVGWEDPPAHRAVLAAVEDLQGTSGARGGSRLAFDRIFLHVSKRTAVDDTRAVDRSLQRLRKANRLKYESTLGWRTPTSSGK